MKFIVGIALLFSSAICYSANIGLGQVIAVKQYDINSSKFVRIYLHSSSTHQNFECIANGRLFGQITHSQHDEPTINRMFSLATAAYMSGKKIRLYSENGSCEIDFVALQEEEF